MNIQIDTLFHKLIDYLRNYIIAIDDGAPNIHRLVRNFLFREFQKENPTLSIQQYNKFVDEFNAFIESQMISEEGNGEETEAEQINQAIFRELFSEKLKGFKFYQYGFPMDDSHQVDTLWNVAIITYFTICTVIKNKNISVLDLTKFIPEPFGFDLDYETPSGLLLRYILDFRKSYSKYACMANIRGTAITADDLTNHLCKTDYPEIQWLSSPSQITSATQDLYNVAIINTQNKPQFYTDHIIEDGQDYEIDYIKYENELKKAIASTDQNHVIISILPISIFYKEAVPSIAPSVYSDSHITDDIIVLRPMAKDWEWLYSLYSRFGLKINNIICIDTVFSEPDSPWENKPGMCAVTLSAENAMNNDKVLFAEFENGINVDNMLKIVQRKEKVTAGTWTETTSVFYLDQDVHFYGLINDVYIRQCNKDKKSKLIRDGFKVYMGSELLQQVENYISQYDKDFQENSSSIFIPASYDIFSSAACIGYSFDDYYSLIIKRNIPLRLFDLTQIPWYQYLITKYEHDSKMLVELKHEITKNEVGYEFDFDFNKFGLQIENDKIICGNKVIQTFELPSRYTALNDMIERQIVKANTYQLILNSDLVSIQYLKILQGTELYDELLKKWIANCEVMDTAEAFNVLEFALPSIENQRRIVSYNNHLNLSKNEIEKKRETLRHYLGGVFDDYDNTYLSVENFNFDNQPYRNNELEQLPQPIASLLYLDQCEDIVSRKNANLFHLFEAVANFHSVVCLSILKAMNSTLTESIIESLVVDHLLYNLKKRVFPIQFAFGTWTSLLSALIKKVEDNKIPYFDVKTTKELISALNEARILRNENSGHAPRMSEKIEAELYTRLSTHCESIINTLLNIYDKYTLIVGPYQVIETTDDGGQLISCFKAMGNTPRFVNQKIHVYSGFDFQNHVIYLVPQSFHSVPIPILPFVTYMPLCEKDDKLQSLVYVHDIKMNHDKRHDERRITWYSYDCGDNNRTVRKYDEDKSTKDLIDWLEPYWRKYLQQINNHKSQTSYT